MKILHTVQRYAPDTGGSEEVVRQLSEYLVSFGHDVTVATGASDARDFVELNGVKIVPFRCSGNVVEGCRGEIDVYREFLRGSRFDLMMNYAAQIWSTDLVFDLLDELPAKRVLVPCGYSRLRDPKFASYFAGMPDVLRRYDRIVYLSDNYIDKEFGDSHGLRNGVVIPNGADKREFLGAQRGQFRARHGLDDGLMLLNVSNHSRLKNHRFFWNVVSALDHGDVRAVLVGNAYTTGPARWLKECYLRCHRQAGRLGAMILEGAARSEVVDAYMDADVFVFGSLVECSPLVMFEAFASRTLFVTTDCGNVKDYSDIVCIVRDEREAIEVIRDYQKNPSTYRDRIERGYRIFTERVNWESIAREYEQLYKELLR